ncbi:MAG: hypothetical protein Q7U03_09255 [Syntrophales bacterium]|nr:hypothetical protein [Syntrophales bacterium]
MIPRNAFTLGTTTGISGMPADTATTVRYASRLVKLPGVRPGNFRERLTRLDSRASNDAG